MSKMSKLSAILDEMITAGNAMVKSATTLKEFYSSASKEELQTKEPKKKSETKEEAPAPEKNTYSYEEVRKICAGKSAENDGVYKREVLAIVKKYAALVAEVEVIGNVR